MSGAVVRDPGALAPSGGPAQVGGGRRGRVRRSIAQLAGAAGVVVGSAGLGDLILGTAWREPLVWTVAAVVALGLAATWLGLRWWVALACQVAAVGALALGQSGTAPGRLLAVLGEALTTVSHAVPPAELDPALLLGILLAFGLVAAGVDACIRTRPALAGIGLLAIVAALLVIAEGETPVLGVLGPLAAYLLVLALTAVPLDATSGRRSRLRVAGAAAGAGAVLAAAGIAVGFAAPGYFPGIGVGGTFDRSQVASGRIGADPMTGLTGDLLRQDPAPVLRLRPAELEVSPGTLATVFQPDYLRAAVLTQYVPGGGWEIGPLTSGAAAAGLADAAATITPVGYAGWFLPVPDGTVAAPGLDPVWVYDPLLGIWHTDRARQPEEFVAEVSSAQPTFEDLEVDTVNPSPEELALDGVPPEVVALAEEITAGTGGPFAAARALQDFFLAEENGFTYDLSVPAGSTGDPLLDFLEVRQGFCEQYASTMAVLARAAGLPARVVVGYGPGNTTLGETLVTTHDAHAWVEIRFDSSGWVRFEPTPPDGIATRLAGWAPPVTPAEPGDGEGEEQPTAEAAESPTDASTGPLGVGPEIDDDGAAAATPALRPRVIDVPGWAWGAAVGVVVLVLAVGPQLERARRRRVRLANGAAGGWAEIEALAADHGVALPPAASVRDRARAVAYEAAADATAREALAARAVEVEREWYAAAESGAPGAQKRDARADIATVRRALARARPRRGWRRWFPRSLLPARLRARRR